MPRPSTTTSYAAAVEALADAGRQPDPDADFVRRIGAVLDELPRLSRYRWELVLAMESVLSADTSVDAMAGGPTSLLGDVSRENVTRAGARRRVLDEPMVDAGAVATLLGSRSVNRGQYASQRRRRGDLLGIPVANRYVFPAFQFDSQAHRVIPVVAEVNRMLDALADPWGVASWWFSPSARLGSERPADVAADAARSGDLLSAARSVVAPLG